MAKFQSTPSVGRATRLPHRTYTSRRISIHALRGEGDSKSTQKSCAAFAKRVQSFPRRAA